MTEGHLDAGEGVRLFYRRWNAPAQRALCLVAHGLGEHGGRYAALAEALNAKGFSVWAADHRGHGRSGGRRGDCRGVNGFVDDLRLLHQTARAAAPGAPVFLIGHSLGGLIALAYAVRYGSELKGVAVSSPALKLKTEPSPLKTACVLTLARWIPFCPIPNGVGPQVLCRDAAVVRAYEADPLVHRVLTARCAAALRVDMRRGADWIRALSVPALILQAGQDRICDADAAERIVRQAETAGGPVRWRRFDGLYHELFNEPERAEVIGVLTGWLEEHLAA